MNKLQVLLVVAGLLLGTTGFSNALANGWWDDDDPRHQHRGLRAAVKALHHRVQQNTARIEDNADNIADNFAAINSNSMDISDLGERLSDLENGGSGGGGEVLVDCLENANALLEDPVNGYFPDDTTYLISGRCNGPLYVTEDRVRFIGVTDDAAIVMPGPPDITDPSDGTVFGDGAHDLRIQNMLIDVSAWGSGAIANGSDAAGVYARNAYIRVIDTRIVGGQWSINPFRNAIVRTQGLVELIDYVNTGLSVGDQSMITARGPVVMRTNVTDGSYLGAVDVYRSGVIDFRAGVTIEHPPADPDIDFYPYAIGVYRQSHLRIRDRGDIDIGGDVFLNMLGSANIDGGELNGNISVQENSAMTMNGVDQSGDIYVSSSSVVIKRGGELEGSVNVDTGANLNLEYAHQSDGSLFLGLNSTARFNDSTIGFVEAVTGSAFEINEGEFDGAQVSQNSVGTIFGGSTTADIQVFGPASINYTHTGTGSLYGNTIFLCGTMDSNIDPAIAASGTVSPFCGP